MLPFIESLLLKLKDYNVRGYQNVQHLHSSFVVLEGSSMLAIQFISKFHWISRYSTIMGLICHLNICHLLTFLLGSLYFLLCRLDHLYRLVHRLAHRLARLFQTRERVVVHCYNPPVKALVVWREATIRLVHANKPVLLCRVEVDAYLTRVVAKEVVDRVEEEAVGFHWGYGGWSTL